MKPGTKKFLACTAAFTVGAASTVAYRSLFPADYDIGNIDYAGDNGRELGKENTNPKVVLSHADRFASGYIDVGSNHETEKDDEVQMIHNDNVNGDERNLGFFSWLAGALGGDSSSDSGDDRRVDSGSNDTDSQQPVGVRGSRGEGGVDGEVEGSEDKGEGKREDKGEGDNESSAVGEDKEGDDESESEVEDGGKNEDRGVGEGDGGGSGGAAGEESIAASMARMQIKFRSPPSSANQRSPGAASTIEVNPYPCALPKIRYVPWNKLTEDTRQIVGLLGYDSSTWDYKSPVIVEDAPFKAFDESQKKAALFIGIDECVWDCFFNHYKAYSTEELAQLGLDGHVPTMLEMQSKYWKEMSDEEKETATKFCYFEEVWDGEALGTWRR
ncbi:hypothetical protein ACHAWU_000643 [Discostella pseudostelligera]|uniref:Uncharacterized protein n=1 Tax=Discostella pseudostelligera TaxID=259834 RepID=A0ABD3MHI3_9STRA